MKVAILLLGLCFVCYAGEANDESLFNIWKNTYNKKYNNESVPFASFKQSMARIAARNVKSTSAIFGLTKYSDLTVEEFKVSVLGYIPSEDRPDVGVLSEGPKTAPKTWDWRKQYKVTPVRNQGQCGSCWAFSAVENIESLYCIKNNLDGRSFSPLSAQEIVDCDTNDDGCYGGIPSNAFQFVMQEGGLESDKDYNYTGIVGTCNFQANLVKVKISDWKYATQNSDEGKLQSNLVNWGPLSICVDAESWQDYVGGILMASDCGNTLDHCVQLVGYDMTQSIPFWIIRNSWGTDWGENGYIRLQYGQDACGCADEATSAIL